MIRPDSHSQNGTHIFIMLDNCSRQSRMENLPDSNFFAISFCLSGLAIAMSCLPDQLGPHSIMTELTYAP